MLDTRACAPSHRPGSWNQKAPDPGQRGPADRRPIDWRCFPMRILVVSQDEVPRLLPMAGCMDAMAAALRALAQGGALLPLRTVLRLPSGGAAFAVMPAYLATPAAIGLKAITVFPGN